ncbi:MAG: class I SAM-dependent methyltransferase [Candidatus Adiutrix sp.]|jgi:SAM-dependent methyltransferase|nr:class I SAM-dependent methyltransferase [Candidatus Adiutrix sp.]
MSFNPSQLLNNPLALMTPGLVRPPAEENQAPVPPPPFDPAMYQNAFSRLGLLSIENVADLGCGAGNFVSVMIARHQRPEVYLGIDHHHSQISIAKAAYPGWKFIYGDFTQERIRAEYERYGAFLMLNLLETVDDDLAFLATMPEGKPLVFSVPRFEGEAGRLFLPDNSEVYERYSSILSIRSIGIFRNAAKEAWSMVVAARW